MVERFPHLDESLDHIHHPVDLLVGGVIGVYFLLHLLVVHLHQTLLGALHLIHPQFADEPVHFGYVGVDEVILVGE